MTYCTRQFIGESKFWQIFFCEKQLVDFIGGSSYLVFLLEFLCLERYGFMGVSTIVINIGDW